MFCAFKYTERFLSYLKYIFDFKNHEVSPNLTPKISVNCNIQCQFGNNIPICRKRCLKPLCEPFCEK